MPFSVPSDALACLSSTSRECIERLQAHESEPVDLSIYPISRRAAVLVLLYEKAGVLRVLLTTRSKSLRSHPGQTALPGGKVDEEDADVIETAYREAHEEVGLPRHCPDVHTLTIIRPYIAASKLFVTPVVALLTDLTVLGKLVPCASEVDRIFDHPLEAILKPSLMSGQYLAEKGSEDWIYDTDLHSTSDTVVPFMKHTLYRMHRFRSSASPIKGLTSDILIAVAEVAYARPPAYERWVPGQANTFGLTLLALQADDRAGQATSGTATPTFRNEVGVPAGVESSAV